MTMEMLTEKKKKKTTAAILTTLAAVVMFTGGIALFSVLTPNNIYASGIGEGFGICLLYTAYPPVQTAGCSSNPLMDHPISI
jgi:hypothetical protein